MIKKDLALLEDVRRGATIKIAASNATDKSKTAADYVCDGTADEVELSAAIAELPSGGGSIELSEGTFNLNSNLLINKSNIFITGQGRATFVNNDISTVIEATNNELTISNCFIRYIILSGSSIKLIHSRFVYITNISETIINNCTATTLDNTGGLLLILTGNKISTLSTNVNILPSTTAALKDVNNITTVNFV